ncbi:MAG: NAD(P)-dependent oxidoreductase [Planctomycetota bacterium]|nr:MAG: NAD(P)-dependent oxidoreductase [Planctomycetota bacterium]
MGDGPTEAHVAKLCSNFLIATVIESLGEAFTLAEKNGLPPQALYDALTEFLFNCLIYKGYGAHILSGKHDEPLFRLRLGLKDLNLVAQTAFESETPMPLVSLLKDRYTSSKALGRGDWDWTAVALEIRRQAGLPPVSKTDEGDG